MNKKYYQTFNLLAGPALFFMIYFWPVTGLSFEGRAVLAGTAWVAYWWITEAAELPVTSLIPILVFPLSGALPLDQTTTSYGNPFIFLFMGGFLIGLAIEKWNLHKRIAFKIISLTGVKERHVLLGFMLATAFLSMWISNTATAVMMLPIGMSVAGQFKSDRFGKNLMLGIAYAASIGGMATLIGTPPNIILAGVIQQSLGVNISFFSWMLFATPFSLALLWTGWYYLSRSLKNSAQPELIFRPEPLGKMSTAEKRVLAVFCLTAFLWLTRTLIWVRLFPAVDDTIIAIFGALLLFLIPAGTGKKKLLDWQTGKGLPWDVLLIFGAGLAIAKGFSQTDLTTWLAAHFEGIGLWPWAVLLLIIASINFLTEITSNTATASIILPLLFSMSVPLGMEPVMLLAGAALACSCAFMLPVATPPNAIVFSSGHLKIGDMVRTGIVMNLISILLIFAFVKFLSGVLL